MSNFSRHRGPVTSTASVPNTRKVVSGAYDGAVALFDLDGSPTVLLGFHRHLVNRVVVDLAAGRRAASCSSDYTTQLWDLTTLQHTQTLLGHSDDVEDFLFINEIQGISASRDHRILVWDLRTGAIEHVFDQHERDVLSLAFHDGKLYSSGDDKTLRVWDVDAGRLLNTFGPFDVETDTCAIDAVHGRVLLGCDDGAIRVFDVATGEMLRSLVAHKSGIKKVAVSGSGDFLSAAYDQRILVWDAATLECKLELQNVMHKWERSFSFSHDGRSVLAGTFDGTVLEWDAASGQKLREVGADGEGNACFNRVAAVSNGTLVAVSDDGWIRTATITADSAAWETRSHPPGDRMLMNAVAIDCAQSIVVAGAHDQRLHRYDVRDTQLTNHREVHLGEGPINFISFAEQPGAIGDCFVACYSGRVVRLSANGEVSARLDVHEGAVKSVRIHPDSPLGFSCSADGKLCSWTFDGQIQERYLGHTAIINDLDLDPLGQRLASVSRDFTLKIYDVASGRLQQSMLLGSRSLKSVCFVDDNIVLVGDYWGGLIRVDLGTGVSKRKQIARNGVSSVSRCGELVVAASYDGGLYGIDPSLLTVVQVLATGVQRPAYVD